MVCAFSHPDPSIATLVQHALENEGIDAVVRNTALGAALGEVPPIAAWAEVWIADEARLDEAHALARTSMARDETATPWTCPSCSEPQEAAFGACWQCGTAAPAVEA